MRRLVAVVFCVVSMAGLGYAQHGVLKEIPKETRAAEVKIFLDNYSKDSTAKYGPLYAKRAGHFNDSVKIRDLKTRTIEIYDFKHTFLEAHPDTIPFSELIQPSGYWFVMVMAHNKPLYQLALRNLTGEPEFVGMVYLGPNSKSSKMWELLLETYPESSGINPVFFSPYGWAFGSKERFLYFEQKGPRKIYYLRTGRLSDPLAELFPSSIKTLDDSKKLVEYWKKRGLNEVGLSWDEIDRRRAQEAKDGGKK